MRVTGFECAWIAGVLLFIGRAAHADCRSPQSRSVIKFYEYQGTQTLMGAEKFGVFRKVIDEEVVQLNSSAQHGPAFPVLATEPDLTNAKFYAKGSLDGHVSRSLMKADIRLLELLDGFLQENPQTHYYQIHSDIYVFAPEGAVDIAPISETYELRPDAYQETYSVHMAATYYAKSVAASVNSCRTQQVYNLSKAAEVLRDVRSPGPGAKALRLLITTDQRSLGLLP